jgi:hypothetical protein
VEKKGVEEADREQPEPHPQRRKTGKEGILVEGPGEVRGLTR